MKKLLLTLSSMLLVSCGGGGGGGSTPIPQPLTCTLPQVINSTGTACELPVPTPIATTNEVRYDTLVLLNTLRFFGSCSHGAYTGGSAPALTWSTTLEAEASIHIQQVAVTV